MERKTISMPKFLLHLEGAVLFIGAIMAYIHIHGDGWLFIILLLAPDLSAIGYLRNPQIGSIMYNTVHNYLLPALLILTGLGMGSMLIVEIALIWFAHLGMDRTVGFGLKYPTRFGDTHLSHV